MANEKHGIVLGFFSKALQGDDRPLSLLGVDGREALSRPFAFDLLLVRRGDPLDQDMLAALVHDPCVIALGLKKTDVVHGFLSSIELVRGAPKAAHFYRARLVPIVDLLSLGRRSAIYEDTTIPDMIAAILSSHGLTKGKDFDIHASKPAHSPKHEYVVQYQESELDASSSDGSSTKGYFYWFTHGPTEHEARLASPIRMPTRPR